MLLEIINLVCLINFVCSPVKFHKLLDDLCNPFLKRSWHRIITLRTPRIKGIGVHVCWHIIRGCDRGCDGEQCHVTHLHLRFPCPHRAIRQGHTYLVQESVINKDYENKILSGEINPILSACRLLHENDLKTCLQNHDIWLVWTSFSLIAPFLCR